MGFLLSNSFFFLYTNHFFTNLINKLLNYLILSVRSLLGTICNSTLFIVNVTLIMFELFFFFFSIVNWAQLFIGIVYAEEPLTAEQAHFTGLHLNTLVQHI